MSGAIDKYVYMLVHTVFQQRYRMKYSEVEEVDTIDEIRHPILRETLSRHWRGNLWRSRRWRTCRREPGWDRPERSRCAS